MSPRVLHFIGKGQITIPQDWRALLGMKSGAIKATLSGSKIIIESLPLEEEKNWNVEWVTFNDLSKADIALVKEGRKAYKTGEKEKFLTASEFFKE